MDRKTFFKTMKKLNIDIEEQYKLKDQAYKKAEINYNEVHAIKSNIKTLKREKKELKIEFNEFTGKSIRLGKIPVKQHNSRQRSKKQQKNNSYIADNRGAA